MSLVKTVNRKVSTTGFWYVVEARLRNMLKWTRIIIFVAIANPVLYLISIGIGVGSLMDGNSPVDGVNYLTFLAPALLASAAIQGMLDEVIFPTFQGFKWYKNFFAMNATPLTGRDIAGGVFFSALIRTFFTVTVYTITLYFFGTWASPKIKSTQTKIYEWGPASWPNILVWTSQMKEMLKSDYKCKDTIHTVGPIWFEDSAEKLPNITAPAIAVFNLESHRISSYQGESSLADWYLLFPNIGK